MLKQQIEQDLKQALLSGDKERANTLRSLKSVILYAEVAEGSREAGLSDDKIIDLFTKEVKKRHESADFFIKGGAEDRAATELAEKAIIEGYLPKQLSDDELIALIDDIIGQLRAEGPGTVGQVIGAVKQRAGASADGGRVARFTKERLARP